MAIAYFAETCWILDRQSTNRRAVSLCFVSRAFSAGNRKVDDLAVRFIGAFSRRSTRGAPDTARRAGWMGAFTPTDADAMPASALVSVLPAAAPRVSARGAPRSSSRSARRAVRAAASNTVDARFALLFDCDGVIVETGA
jgi:hypothetical protein